MMVRAALLLACLFALPAVARGSATLGLGGQVFATGGEVIVRVRQTAPGVPEPTTGLLLGLGVLGVSARRRRGSGMDTTLLPLAVD